MTTQLYRDAVGTYLTMQKDHADAKKELNSFKATCNRDPPQVSLPRSIPLDITKRVHFKAVDDSPDFYSKYMQQLQQLEHDMRKQIYEIMIAAKEQHLEHLRIHLIPITFIQLQMKKYLKHVETYAARIEQSTSATSTSEAADNRASSSNEIQSSFARFPTRQAMDHFESHLLTRINEEISRRVQADMESENQSEASVAANNKAKETIMKGAHTGDTLQMLATRAAEKAIAPLQRKLAALPQPQISQWQLYNPLHLTDAKTVTPHKTDSKKRRREKQKPTDVAKHEEDAMDVDSTSSQIITSINASGGDPHNTQQKKKQKQRHHKHRKPNA